MRNGWRQVVAHVFPDIDPNQVNQAKSSCLGAAQRRARDRIHLINGISILKDIVQCEGPSPKAQTIGDEIGGIFAQHNALAQAILTKTTDQLHHLGQRFGGRDDLQQLQVARRVEKVSAQEMLAKTI